jgi:PAS domain-containing protein
MFPLTLPVSIIEPATVLGHRFRLRSWRRDKRIFGYTANEAIGHHVQMLIPPDRLNEQPEILNRIRRGERIEHCETVRRRKDGATCSRKPRSPQVKFTAEIDPHNVGRANSRHWCARSKYKALVAGSVSCPTACSQWAAFFR